MAHTGVDAIDESPIFIMGCLSPSRDEEEPPTIRLFETMDASPECSSLLPFRRDQDEAKEVRFVADENSFNATSAGLMAAGLAWVYPNYTTDSTSPTKKQSIMSECRYPIELLLKERLQEQKRLDRIQTSVVTAAPPNTPNRPHQINTQMEDLLENDSLETSPSFISRVYTNLTAKVPLASNSSIHNNQQPNTLRCGRGHEDLLSGTTCGKEDLLFASSCESTPRLNPINNSTVYSFSNLLATPPAITGRKDQPEDEATTRDVPILAPPTSYFCQQETSTTALIQVLTRTGSSFEDDLDDAGSCQDHSTRSIIEEEDEDEDEADDDDEDIHGVSWIPPVRCVSEGPAGVTNSSILTPLQMHQIARHVLPKGIASCQWKRLYSLVRDGDSFDVCLHYARHDPRTLLVLRTTRGAVMGGYAGEVWQPKADGYYGKSETCLFTFEEKKEVCENVDPLRAHSPTTTFGGGRSNVKTPTRTPSSKNGGDDPSAPQSPPLVRQGRPKKSLLDADNYKSSLPPIRVYRYTGVNRYIQYCDAGKKMMALGGGGEDGSFGLCVVQEFQSGSTGPCATFDNEPLCDQENFKIMDVELWGFLTGQF